MDTSLTDAEKTLIDTRVVPTLSQFQSTLYELKDVKSSSEFTGVSVVEIMILNARVKDTSTSLFEIFENLKLPIPKSSQNGLILQMQDQKLAFQTIL